ncbi:FMN-dependent NADH-azoreductase [Sansalvadorimonas verongulae]|uniref:FMN-dependent NADH-azoreductase n=1 Tax=Sansalvadorimonas verongulae TaxID=2172824 RepID=UPI0012BC685B|nr:FMN-dependent NADH-azoreductase [Sansalvadorimonas verongulae]MTI12925.1 FMN-dependent NADH-azoreductase [Sansalvadorimonas verongulae]
MSILILKSSILGEHSQSNAVIDQALGHTNSVKVRDLAREQVPVLDASIETALRGGSDLSDSQQAAVKLSDQLIDELKAADSIVIAAPMYNFMIPTQLKNYFDLIARAGVTFKYTEQGVVGLLENKKVVVVTTRGGIHVESDRDHITGYLKTMLGFIGLTDVEFVYAEALSMGEEQAATNREAAVQQLQTLIH